jgi:hypothetical protein
MSGPYPSYTADPSVIALELQARIVAAAATFTPAVDPIDVFYGDQDRLPHTPSICVEPGDASYELAGLPNMTENLLEVFILVYHNQVQDLQQTRLETDELASQIRRLLHQDLQLQVVGGPLLTHGYVRAHESGYTYKQKTLYRSARLVYVGKNKTSLQFA